MMISRRSVCSAQVASGSARVAAPCLRQAGHRSLKRSLVVYAEPETAVPGEELENPDSESSRKKSEAERLRAAEKFMVLGSGKASCKSCGWEYNPDKGDPDFPIAKGTNFQDTPDDYFCPICGAPKKQFESRQTVVAGFAENQRYGFGTNSMTEGQKLALIYGGLIAAFMLFLSGYAMN